MLASEDLTASAKQEMDDLGEEKLILPLSTVK